MVSRKAQHVETTTYEHNRRSGFPSVSQKQELKATVGTGTPMNGHMKKEKHHLVFIYSSADQCWLAFAHCNLRFHLANWIMI